MRKCAFCPTEASKLSGEHLWDDWLNRVVSTKRYKARYGTLKKETIEWDTNALNHKLPVVCSTCNSTWMSRLGEELKLGFASSILDGSRLSILPSGLSLLSAYALLKASVMDYTYCDGEPFFTRAAREGLRMSRTIPTSAQIWIAEFRGEAAFSTRANIRHYENTGPEPVFVGIEWFAFSYVVGFLTLQLLIPRWKDVRRRGPALPTMNPNRRWEEAAIRIWPIGGLPVSWPPPLCIGDRQFNIFANRFGAPVEVRAHPRIT
jgi:hypothetical protein